MTTLTALLAAASFSVQVHGKGPALILIPGLASSGEVWDGAVARYEDRYQVHVLTLAGFAGQLPIDPPLLARVRDDLGRYIREQKLDRPVIAGHSLGAFVALWLAAKEPDLVGKVVAVDGVPFLPALFNPGATEEQSRPGARMMRKQLEGLTPEQFAAQNRRAVSGMVKSPADVDRVASWGARSDQRAVAAAMEELMCTDLRPLVSRIKEPVLLVAAGVPAEMLARYQAQVASVPRHRVVSAQGARHFIMLDDPGYLFARIDEFLGEK